MTDLTAIQKARLSEIADEIVTLQRNAPHRKVVGEAAERVHVLCVERDAIYDSVEMFPVGK